MAVPCEKCQGTFGPTLMAQIGLCTQMVDSNCNYVQNYCIKNGQTAKNNITEAFIDTFVPSPTSGNSIVINDFNGIYTVLFRIYWYGVFDQTNYKTFWEIVNNGETPNINNLAVAGGSGPYIKPSNYPEFSEAAAVQDANILVSQYNKILDILDIQNANIAAGTSLTRTSMNNLRDYLKNYSLHTSRCWTCNVSKNCGEGCGDCGNTTVDDGCGCYQGCNDLCSGCNCSLYCDSFG